MCGRTAYSMSAVSSAKNMLHCSMEDNNESICANETGREDCANASPGQSFQIFRRSRNDDKSIDICTGIWGLVPNNGTKHTPHLLPTDSTFSVSPHYTMFNARSETIYEKNSFSGLINGNQTCVLAVDGYYEWTESQSSSDKRKQPYFVCNKSKQRRPLLLAGLWTCVKTGKQVQNQLTQRMQDETITTFTILTTDAHPNYYTWLHPRQPIMLWNTQIALEWLLRPTHAVVEKLRTIPIKGSTELKLQSIWENELLVYPVSKQINDPKYQGTDCTEEVKLEKIPSIKSFFSPTSVAKRVKTTHEKAGPSSDKQEDLSTAAAAAAVKNDVQISTKDCTTESKSIVSHENERGSCACSKCTFIHTGHKLEYLACDMCGSSREEDNDDNNNTGASSLLDASIDDANRGRKRKAI